MVQNTKCKFIFLAILAMFVFDGTCQVTKNKVAEKKVSEVNSKWRSIEYALDYSFVPYTENELIQLHLLNVISYLKSQPSGALTTDQKLARINNINLLSEYVERAEFPINTFSEKRLPIFIDENDRYCAVGFLLKESGQDEIAKEIAENQLLCYLEEINHPKLEDWQKSSGLTTFELALIQPTYGPPIPVCAAPSPVEWNDITDADSKISKFFESKNSTAFYGVSPVNDSNLEIKLKRFSAKTFLWNTIGNSLFGEITELVEAEGEVYIAVVLPLETVPFQLLKLKNKKWEKIAQFNGSITGIQTLNNKLYVVGNFTRVNNSIEASFVEIENDVIKKFSPHGLRTYEYDNMVASETTLFLTNRGSIYKFKNDTLNYLTNIKYYSYIKNISLDAVEDTVYVSSISIQGYFAYHSAQEKTVNINNMMQGQDFPYRSINFTKSKMIDGKMLIAGDFKSSTLIPQINDERYLVKCDESQSANWYGEGLLYQQGHNFYPILEEGTVLDFIEINNYIFILLNDGTMYSAGIDDIEQKINSLEKKRMQTSE